MMMMMMMMCYMIVFTKYYSRTQIKKNGKGRECGKYGGGAEDKR